jgi:hypothetical protein
VRIFFTWVAEYPTTGTLLWEAARQITPRACPMRIAVLGIS